MVIVSTMMDRVQLLLLLRRNPKIDIMLEYHREMTFDQVSLLGIQINRIPKFEQTLKPETEICRLHISDR